MRHQSFMPLLVAGAALAASSCSGVLEPPNHTYDGPAVVEFAPVMPAGKYALSVSFAAGSTTDQTVNVGVNYVGAAPAQAVTGTFTVSGTAVSGTHYTVSGTTYTIAAGSNTTSVPFTIHAAALADGQSVSIALTLAAPGSGVGVSENYKTFTITIGKAAS